MQHAPEDGNAIYTMDELLGRIRTSLGGRAAEIVYYGERDGISTGASGDLASATNLAQQIVCTYGMSEDFGLAVFGGAMTDEVRAAVNRILKEQM
jgi:ATP-dependent Zn protease